MDAAASACPLCINAVDRRVALYCSNAACVGVAHWSCMLCWQTQHERVVRCLNCSARFPEHAIRLLAMYKKIRWRLHDGSFSAPQLRFVSENIVEEEGGDPDTDTESDPEPDPEPDPESDPEPDLEPEPALLRRRSLTVNQVLWVFIFVMLFLTLRSLLRTNSSRTTQPPHFLVPPHSSL